jgi:hypothetical protein
MAWFLNRYVCEECDCEWEDEWSAMCDDDCPHCGSRHMTPYDSIDRSEIIREDEGKFLVYASRDSAEDRPDYVLVAIFSRRGDAEQFIKCELPLRPIPSSPRLRFLRTAIFRQSNRPGNPPIFFQPHEVIPAIGLLPHAHSAGCHVTSCPQSARSWRGRALRSRCGQRHRPPGQEGP